MIFETPAECGVKTKVGLNLLDRNGLSLISLLFSAISAVFERVGD